MTTNELFLWGYLKMEEAVINQFPSYVEQGLKTLTTWDISQHFPAEIEDGIITFPTKYFERYDNVVTKNGVRLFLQEEKSDTSFKYRIIGENKNIEFGQTEIRYLYNYAPEIDLERINKFYKEFLNNEKKE